MGNISGVKLFVGIGLDLVSGRLCMCTAFCCQCYMSKM